MKYDERFNEQSRTIITELMIFCVLLMLPSTSPAVTASWHPVTPTFLKACMESKAQQLTDRAQVAMRAVYQRDQSTAPWTQADKKKIHQLIIAWVQCTRKHIIQGLRALPLLVLTLLLSSMDGSIQQRWQRTRLAREDSTRFYRLVYYQHWMLSITILLPFVITPNTRMHLISLLMHTILGAMIIQRKRHFKKYG